MGNGGVMSVTDGIALGLWIGFMVLHAWVGTHLGDERSSRLRAHHRDATRNTRVEP